MTRALGRWMGAAGRIPHGLAVGGLIALYAILAIVAAAGDASTYDEGTHLSSGYAILDRGDLRISPEHPPLGKMWAALGTRLSGVGEVDYECDGWRRADGFVFGFRFLYGPPGDERRRAPLERLLPARIAMVVLGLFMGLVVYAWSRQLWGRGGGAVALALYALSPLVLAHTHLVTTDGPAALGFVLTMWLFWRFCRRPSWKSALLVGAGLGVAMLLKTSCILAIPICAVAGVVRMLHARALARRMLAGVPVVAIAAYAVLWAGYGFRFRMSPDATFAPAVPASKAKGLASEVMQFAASRRLLPEGYTRAFTFAATYRGLTYLNGEVVRGDLHRIWYFYPEVMLLKSTPAELAALALVAFLAWRRRRKGFICTYLAIGIAGYLVASIASGIYLGQRHLLPLYTLIYVGAGAAARVRAANVRGRAIVAAVLASHALSSFSACPRHLAYFNLLGGGPERASQYLVDSNLDWGQDLSRLKPEMERLGVPSVHLMYFGTADPRAYRIPHVMSVWSQDILAPRSPTWPRPGDYIAVSVTMLRTFERQHVFFRELARLKPIGRAGDGILIYRLPP